MDKGDERKKQLLQVALDVFIEKGYYGTSTREIARRAGVSSGLLFHYFNNKESIYLELVKIGVGNENRYRNSNGSTLRISFPNHKEYI